MFDLERAKALAASLSKPVEQLQPSDIANTVGELLGLDGKDDQISWAADKLFAYLNEYLDYEIQFEDFFLSTPSDEWGPFPRNFGMLKTIVPGENGPYELDVKAATTYAQYAVDCKIAGSSNADWRWVEDATFPEEKKNEVRALVGATIIARRNHKAMTGYIDALGKIVSQIILWTKLHNPELCRKFDIIHPTFSDHERPKALRLKTLVPFVRQAGFFASELPGASGSICDPYLRVDGKYVDQMLELASECEQAGTRYTKYSVQPYRYCEWSEIGNDRGASRRARARYGDKTSFNMTAPDGAEEHLGLLWSRISRLLPEADLDDRERAAGAYTWLATRDYWREERDTVNGGLIQTACNPFLAMAKELRYLAWLTRHPETLSVPKFSFLTLRKFERDPKSSRLQQMEAFRQYLDEAYKLADRDCFQAENQFMFPDPGTPHFFRDNLVAKLKEIWDAAHDITIDCNDKNRSFPSPSYWPIGSIRDVRDRLKGAMEETDDEIADHKQCVRRQRLNDPKEILKDIDEANRRWLHALEPTYYGNGAQEDLDEIASALRHLGCIVPSFYLGPLPGIAWRVRDDKKAEYEKALRASHPIFCDALKEFDRLASELIAKSSPHVQPRPSDYREPDNSGQSNTKMKRSTANGDAQLKMIGKLNDHHGYYNGSCGNFSPIASNELARQSEVSGSTASLFFSKQFGGYNKYVVQCSKTDLLVRALKLLNQEYTPKILNGRPLDDRDSDEEEVEE